MISMFKQYKPMKKKIAWLLLSNYDPKIYKYIYIFQILALGILTNLKSQIEMWLLERFQNKFYLLDKWISWELGCFSTKFFYVSYFDCQNVQWKKMERIWK